MFNSGPKLASGRAGRASGWRAGLLPALPAPDAQFRGDAEDEGE